MHLNFDNDVKLRLNRFSKLGTWYILALSAIATVAIIGQILIQIHLEDQQSDSRVVNIAGKQRMLSQKISKTVLLFKPDQLEGDRIELIKQLDAAVSLWQISQEGLLHGNDSLRLSGKNSDAIISLFASAQPHFDGMYQNAETIIALLRKNPSESYETLRQPIQEILNDESIFLTGMDRIVVQYADEAHQKVSSLSAMEYSLFIISLVVIGLEIMFIFRPTTRHVNNTVNRLVDSEMNARKLSKEIGELYASLEKSYEQISIVNQPTENPRLFAKTDRGGNVTFVSDSFSDRIGIQKIKGLMRLCDLFRGMKNADDWMDEIVECVSEEKSWQGQLNFEDAKHTVCWADVIITPVFNTENEVDELVVMGTEITQRKAAEQNMNSKNRAEIEKKINQQKFRSVLILEGQEEERKRIAMDIHDGIGQMLTSLKFQIESIDLKQPERAEQKFGELSQLIKEVIKEVRRVTFNLKPTVLGDYGLQSALNVFIHEIGKLTDIPLTYTTQGDIDRLPQKIENNIFRIIQEAINNAIKYSEASAIEVTLAETDDELVIEVKDQGKGFETKLVEARSINIESGRGFFNMYERTEYVNGKLDINSDPGKGTSVVLHVPIRKAVVAEQ